MKIGSKNLSVKQGREGANRGSSNRSSLRWRGALLSGTLIGVTLLFSAATALQAKSAPALLEKPEVIAFVEKLVQTHQINRDELIALLSQSEVKEPILNAMNHQAEAKKWFEYRPIFIQTSRIEQGKQFVEENRDLLTRVEAEFGVSAMVVASIMGVETRWGRWMGRYRVLDALVTLGFYYPRRAQFFQGELEQFILLTQEEKLDPLEQMGSYAGAMGMGQFIPSSFRHYAIDYDENGQRNLWSSVPDATASVANYLAKHGWKKGEPLAVQAEVKGEAWKKISSGGVQRPTQAVEQFKKHGITPVSDVDDHYLANFLVLEGESGPEFWLVFENFYVITRYNRSSMYAMAVFQLAEKIVEKLANE